MEYQLSSDARKFAEELARRDQHLQVPLNAAVAEERTQAFLKAQRLRVLGVTRELLRVERR